MNAAWDVQEDLERLRKFELNWRTDPATRPLYVTSYVPNLTAVVDVAVCGRVDGMACCCVCNLHQWLTVASLHSMFM